MTARDDLRDCFLSDSRDRFEAAADAFRADVLNEAANALEVAAATNPACAPELHAGVLEGATELRRMAEESTQNEGTPPRRRLTPSEYSAAWHAVEGGAGEEGADPATILNAVLARLDIDGPERAEPQPKKPNGMDPRLILGVWADPAEAGAA